MGRGKIEIKRIEKTSNRQVTYSKRRKGIMKKAKEIAVLCDAEVSLIIIASSGNMHDYCSLSPPKSLIDILEKYHKKSEQRLWDAKHENLSCEIDRTKKENDTLQIQLRHLKGQDVSSLNHKDLMILEAALENGLLKIRQRQSELVDMAKKNERLLEEQNKYLCFVLNQQIAMESAREEYTSQVPFAFRVQPMQPNLQERM